MGVVIDLGLREISTHGACSWRAAWTPRGNHAINFVFPTPRDVWTPRVKYNDVIFITPRDVWTPRVKYNDVIQTMM